MPILSVFQRVLASRKVSEKSGWFHYRVAGSGLSPKLNIRFHDIVYQEHALERGSTSRAIAYVGITSDSQKTYWGCGVHTDIIAASIFALFSAIDRMLTQEQND